MCTSEYVERSPRVNCCAAVGCSRTVERWMLMCPGHWQQLPDAQQLEVTETYRNWIRGKGLVRPYFIARLKALIAIGKLDGADTSALQDQLRARELEAGHER